MEPLPRETIWQILERLSRNDLISLTQTSRSLREIIFSEAFLRYRLSQVGYPANTIVAIKPTSVNPFDWYYLIVEDNLLEDPISIKLNLTVEQAYQRQLSYQDKFRSPAVILLEAIKNRDYATFRKQLPRVRQKDIASTSTRSLFINLGEEIIRSASFTDDVRYLETLLQTNKYRKAFNWTEIVDYWNRRFLVTRPIQAILIEYFPQPKYRPTKYPRLLEETPEGKIILDYLDGKPIQINPTDNLTDVLVNLEQRNLEKALQFYQEYSPSYQFNNRSGTHLYDYYQRKYDNGPSYLIFPFIASDRITFDIKDSINIELSNLDGIYQLIKYTDGQPIELPIVQQIVYNLDWILTYLITIDNAWDAIIYLILTYPLRDDLKEKLISITPSKRKKVIQAAFNGEEINYWYYF